MSSIRSRAPSATSPAVRERMRAVRRSQTSPEQALFRAMSKWGFRASRNTRPVSDLKIKADLVLRGHRLCIFVDGCFWHSCPKHGTVPATNASWWAEKLADVRRRDRRQTRLLRAVGWSVLRIWEHDITETRFEKLNRRVIGCVATRRRKLLAAKGGQKGAGHVRRPSRDSRHDQGR
jgi:DNA mismatch endonuclease (patch repair protein)